jgi:hypothetical protein
MGNDPEELIDQRQPWSRMPTFQKGELLPERQVLQDEIALATKRAGERSDPKKSQIEHGPELYQNRGRALH